MSGVCGCMLFSSKQKYPRQRIFCNNLQIKNKQKAFKIKIWCISKQLSQNKLPSIFQYFDYFGHIDIPINIQNKTTTDARKDNRKGMMFHFLNI